MKIITLPDVLYQQALDIRKDILFYYHVGNKEYFKSKISFKQHCIAFLLSGKKRVLHRDKELMYDNTSCLFFKAGNYVSNEIATDGNPYHSILIFFDNTILREFKFKHKNGKKIGNIPYCKGDIAIPKTTYIHSYLDSVEELLSTDSFSPNMAQIKFEEIMLHFLERYGWEFIDFFISNNVSSREASLRSIIEANMFRNTSIEELAFLCNMSLSTFKREFSKMYDASPGGWLQEKRLDHAGYLMKVKGKTASEIFEEVGYSSLSSFMHSFKKKFGLTTKEFLVEK